MKKKSIFLLFGALSLVIIAVANIVFYEPPTLNEQYINSEVLIGTESIDEILSISKNENYIVCLCSVDEDEMMFLVLKNNDELNLHFRHSFSINSLTNNPKQIMTDDMYLSNEDIVYNVFLDPNSKEIVIDDIEHTVNSVEYNGKRIGFWWFDKN